MNRIKLTKINFTMFTLVLIGLTVILAFCMGNAAATTNTTPVNLTSSSANTLTTSNVTGLVNSSQPKYQDNNQNTGQSQYTGPSTNTTKWIANVTNDDLMSPVIGSDGTIYIGTRFSDGLFAYNPNGSLKWAYRDVEGMTTVPAIGNNGTIYFGTTDGLIALNPNGTLKWIYTTPDSSFTQSPPSIGSDGTIYIIDYLNYNENTYSALYAINSNGTKKWSYNIPSIDGSGLGIIQSQVMGSNGIIYIQGYYQSSVNSFLYAINPNGTLKWSYNNIEEITTTPCIGSDGTIYLGSDVGYLYAINSNGKLKWSYNTGNYITVPPVISSKGIIYAIVGHYNTSTDTTYSTLLALNTNGTLKWAKTINNLLDNAATIGADGTLYITGGVAGQHYGTLYAINPNGTLKWIYQTTYDIDSTPAINSDGNIYFGTWDGKLYALQDLTLTNTTTIKNTSTTTTPISFTSAEINNESSYLIYYVETNSRLPSYVTIANHSVNMPEFLQLITANLLNINKGLNTPLNLKTVNNTSASTETITGGELLKSEYLSIAQDIVNYINSTGTAPSYASTSLGKINFNNLVYIYCKILNFQVNNQRLPNYVTVKPWSTITSTTSAAVLYTIAQKDAQFMDIQGVSDATSLIQLGYGDCWANSEWLYDELNAAGIQARIMGYVDDGYGVGYRHAWVEIYTINGWQSWDYIGTNSQHYGNLVTGTPFVLIAASKQKADILSTGY
ncbi:MAG: PQQ-binding-like beta-propeller repeat protein [Methanobacterium sp.]|jgi:outer membrane protein assembly factor BamB